MSTDRSSKGILEFQLDFSQTVLKMLIKTNGETFQIDLAKMGKDVSSKFLSKPHWP